MKKTILLLFIVASLLSCNKKNCYKCTFTSLGAVRYSKVYCDVTKEELENSVKNIHYESTCSKIDKDERLCYTCTYFKYYFDTSGNRKNERLTTRDTCANDNAAIVQYVIDGINRGNNSPKGDTTIVPTECAVK